MKNLITIALVVFLTLTTSLWAQVAVRAGYDNMAINIGLLAEEAREIDPPNDDTDLAKNNANKADVTKSYSDSSNESGFYLGIAYSISITEKFAVQPEINYIGVSDFNQIQVPILLKYNFANKFNAYGGPNLGFLVDAPSGLNSFNFALDLGLSYDITNNILVEARYDWGLTNLLDGGDSDNYVKLNNFQIGLAYKFGSKK